MAFCESAALAHVIHTRKPATPSPTEGGRYDFA